MSFDVTLPLVMLAAFGLFNLLLSAAVAVGWRVLGRVRRAKADVVLGIRLLPAVGSAALVLTVVLPAFLLHEPPHAHDEPGMLLVVSALFSLVTLGDGLRRGWRAWRTTRALMRNARTLADQPVPDAPEVSVIDVKAPLVGVVGGWRQRIVTAPCVAAACDDEEFRQVLAHERAHRDAWDNLKLLLLLAAPDALAWLPTGRALTEHWRAATELEADEQASGPDPRNRLALASALIKVARLAVSDDRARGGSLRSVGLGGLEDRVRRLLAPSPGASRGFTGLRLLAGAILVPLLAMPLYAPIHSLIEVLVAFGR